MINKNKKKKISIKNKKKGGCFYISGNIPSNIIAKRDQIKEFIWNNLLPIKRSYLFPIFHPRDDELKGSRPTIGNLNYGFCLTDQFKIFINNYDCDDQYSPYFDQLHYFSKISVNKVIGGNKVLNFWECFKTPLFKADVNFNELNLIRFRRHEIKQVFGSFVR